MSTIIAATGAAGNWTAGSAWVGGVAPTAADDAQITVLTTSITIDTGAVCRSADFNGFTGTITAGASGTLVIGDTIAGLSNIAMRLPSGATFAPSAGFLITFISTSATQQTIAIDSGYSNRSITVNCASGGDYAITANLTINIANTFTLSKGTVHFDGATDNSGLTHSIGAFSATSATTAIMNFGTATINVSGTTFTVGGSNSNVTASGATVNMTGAGATFTGSNKTYNVVTFSGGGASTYSCSGGTVGTLTFTGTAGKTDIIAIVANTAVSGTFSGVGNSAINRILIRGNSLGVPSTLTVTGATITGSNNVDFRDITFARTTAGGLDLTNGGANSIGDCGGNTRTGGDSTVTFTTPATQDLTMSTAKSWSDATIWTSRVPLPQDDVTTTGWTGGTLTQDMPRMGKNITFSGISGSPTLSMNTIAQTIYGSLTLSSSIGTLTSGSTGQVVFETRGASTFTSAGKGFNIIQFSMFGGSIALQDAYTATGGSSQILLNNGTLTNPNNMNVSVSQFLTNNNVCRLDMTDLVGGAATWTTTGTGSAWLAGATANFTVNSAGSTISMTDVSATAKTFAGGGKTYNNLSITSDGSAGTTTFTGNNTFASLTVGAGGIKSIILPGSGTTTFKNPILGLGNGTNLITFTASAGSSTIVCNAGSIQWDYVSLTNIIASGIVPFYAGILAHSTDGGGNTSWVFDVKSVSEFSKKLRPRIFAPGNAR